VLQALVVFTAVGERGGGGKGELGQQRRCIAATVQKCSASDQFCRHQAAGLFLLELPQSELTPGLQNQSSSSCPHKLLRHQAASSASPGDQQ
jgi:hypothetical protein